MNETERYKALRKTAAVTLVGNLLLTIAKAVVGVLSGSVAVLSDAVHSFSDVFTTLMVMVGLKFSSKKADNEHPYGHQRIEPMISLFLGFVLGLTALYLGWQGIQALSEGSQMTPSFAALAVTAISIVGKEWMFHYTKARAKRLKSSAMMSDAWHHRTDALSSIAVLIGVGGVFLGWWILEPLATLAVCAIIIKAAFGICRDAINQMIDRAAAPEVVQRIQDIARTVDGVRQVDLLRTRISNNIIFVELEIAVAPNLSVLEGHGIAQRVHDLIEQDNEEIWHCMVHVNPADS